MFVDLTLPADYKVAVDMFLSEFGHLPNVARAADALDRGLVTRAELYPIFRDALAAGLQAR